MTNVVLSLLDGAMFSEVVERIGWVLIHSVWQFSIVVAMLIAAERVLSRNSAALRYLVCAVAMCAMMSASAATFLLKTGRDEYAVVAASTHVDQATAATTAHVSGISADGFSRPPGSLIVTQDDARSSTNRVRQTTPAGTASGSRESAILKNPAKPDDSVAGQLTTARTRITNSLQPWLSSCVLVWLIGVIVAAQRLVAGGHRVWRLRRHGVSPVPDEVVQLLAATAKRLRLHRSVEILQSSLIAGPIVIGWLRPLILLPASSLTGLTTQQLEAVLAHELAHIRRFDYVVNLLQIIFETIFFYHPAVWWTSRRMRIHREDCCDDQAVAVVSTPLTYASALLALYDLQEGSQTSRVPAVALSATGGSLKNRIHRVLSIDHALQSAPGWWLSTGVVSILVLIVGCSWMTQDGLSDDKVPEQKPTARVGDTRSPLLPTPDPLNANADSLPVPLPPALTPEERERVLQKLASLGVSRLDALEITPKQEPGAAPFVAHLRDVPDAAWPLLGRLHTIHRLDLTASRVSPDAFQHIAGLTSLADLTVLNSRFEPQHLESLKTSKQLRTINVMLTVFDLSSEERRARLGQLDGTEQQRFDAMAGVDQHFNHIAEAAILTDRALQELSGLSELRTLKLINTFVSNSGVLALRNMKHLTEVELSVGGNVSREAAEVFGSMQKLEKLTLLGQMDASAAAGLKGASSLKELELRSINHEVATVLSEMPSLQRLKLWGNSLNDECLLQLAKLEQLRLLDIRYPQKGTFTLSGIEQFQAARPGCSVQHDLRVETLSERRIPLPPDLFVVRLYWHKAASRKQLVEHMQSRFGESEHWIEFRPLTREGYVGGMALVRGTAGRDWLQAQIGTDGDFEFEYAEPLTYQRLKDEGVLFDALWKPAANAGAANSSPDESNAPVQGAKETGDLAKTGLADVPSADRRDEIPIVLPGESLPPFQELLARLRERGQNETADGLQSHFQQEQKTLKNYPHAVVVYGQIVAKSGDSPWLCDAPMRIFEDGWFVTGLRDKDQPVGFRMFGCRPVDVVTSQLVPGVSPGATVSLGRIAMEPYPPAELAAVRGRLKFAGDTPPNGIRARVIIRSGPVNSLTGGTDGFREWPEKENVTLTDDLQLEHRQLAPLPHKLHIEAFGYEAVSRDLDLTAGATLDLGVIEIPRATKFQVEVLTSDTADFNNSEQRETTVRLGEVWKSNPDNEALAKYHSGDMRFAMYPVDRRNPDGPQKLMIHSGVASLKLTDLGEGNLEMFRTRTDEPPKLRDSHETTVENGHVYLCYHTHWKHWTLLRVTLNQ